MRILICSLLVFVSFTLAQDTLNNPDITIDEIQNHIKYLASDELEGRFAGTEKNREAAEYIKNQFESYGLLPFYNGSYFQEFDFVQAVEPGDNNSVTLNGKDTLKIKDDFVMASFSGNGSVSGELVFAGYGISSDNLNYDDFAGLDVKDKIVIIMRYNPEHDSSTSKFDSYSALRDKAATARDSGAAGIIFVNGYEPEVDDNLIKWRYDRGPQMKLPVVHVKRPYIEELLKTAGYDLKNVQQKIDDTRIPNSFPLPGMYAELSTEVNLVEAKASNVAGYIEGTDSLLKKQYIVLGAHFDHLGWGQTSSLYRGNDTLIHNGADDNASGTAGLMELAEKLSSQKDSLKHSVIFMAFNAEELGLLGSNYTVNNFPVNIEDVIAMLNMDMIGRVNEENELTVIGSSTSTIWEDMLNKHNDAGFKLKLSGDGFGGSDHQSFTLKDIPVLFFFSGIHSDYHRPSDDWDLINYEGEKNVVDYVYSVFTDLDHQTEKPEFVKVESHGGHGGGNTSFKVYVGTIPDYGWQGDGFKLSGVSEGGPAHKAGLQGGDIMIKFGDSKIVNIYDFMHAMNDHKAGDIVKVVVLRDDVEQEFEVTLEER